jgi:hypothetical protein
MGKRKCVVSLPNPWFDDMKALNNTPQKEPRLIEIDSIFHKWGVETKYHYKRGEVECPSTNTMGIIEEIETGQVHSVYPDKIQFTDEWKQKIKYYKKV